VSVVVGIAPEESNSGALALAGMLARSTEEPLVVTATVPLPWPPHPEALDSDYREHVRALGEQSLERARAQLDPAHPTRFELREARSVPVSLTEAAAEHDASMLVLGSSTAGAFGRVSFGSVIDRLLHGAAVPVALAPRGFRCSATARVTRLTVAFGGAGAVASELLQATSSVSARIRASLRVASFFLRPTTPFAGTVEPAPEDLVLDRWTADASASIQAELEAIAAKPGAPALSETVVGDGYTWAAAIEDVPWQEGDLLVVGSSSSGPAARVFLGSRASKIVRHSPVPVVVVPRATARERAREHLAPA
jgi:nucleotide-binding universal stress UspA family protein